MAAPRTRRIAQGSSISINSCRSLQIVVGPPYEMGLVPPNPRAAAALKEDCDHDDCKADSTAEKAARGEERSVNPPPTDAPLSKLDSCNQSHD